MPLNKMEAGTQSVKKSSFNRGKVVSEYKKSLHKSEGSDKKVITTRYNYANMIDKINKLKIAEFKEKVKTIMLDDGAEEYFINEVLTDSEVQFAINNHLTEEELAWGLMF